MEVLKNFVGGNPVTAEVEDELEVPDPATGELLGLVPLSGAADVDRAVRSAAEAFEEWREEPVTRRARQMFRLQVLLEEHVEELAELCTRENGKHVEESKAEIWRGIEVVELAASMTTLMKGETLDQVSQGVDVALYREPLGVVAAVTPFNFPVMIPLWFAPLAIATGNTFILKPSQRTPLSALRLAELFSEAGVPDGVFNVVHGAKETVEGLIDHPQVKAISSVGSSAAARNIYRRGGGRDRGRAGTEAGRHSGRGPGGLGPEPGARLGNEHNPRDECRGQGTHRQLDLPGRRGRSPPRRRRQGELRRRRRRLLPRPHHLRQRNPEDGDSPRRDLRPRPGRRAHGGPRSGHTSHQRFRVRQRGGHLHQRRRCSEKVQAGG